MNELRQYLRYLIPGTVFYIYGLVFGLVILLPSVLTPELQRMLKAVNLTIGAAAVFLSGGIGYLLSMMHHLFYSRSGAYYPRINHEQFVCEFKDRINSYFGKAAHHIRVKDWVRINVLWHDLIGQLPQCEGLNRRNDSLSDIMHSAGTSLFALVFAAFAAILFSAWLFICTDIKFACSHGISSGVFIALFLILFWAHCTGFKEAVEKQREFVEATLDHMLTLRPKSQVVVTN